MLIKRKIISVSLIVLIIFSTVFWVNFKSFYDKKYVYPKKYENFVDKYAEMYNVNKNFCYAIIKAESGFNERAVSSKGAKGLMQITSPTACYIAQLLNENINSIDLFNVENNIKYGVFYIHYLLSKFESFNEVACAYNAGEGTVTEWLNNINYSKNKKNLYKIPYKETDNYAKKIAKYYKKYNMYY